MNRFYKKKNIIELYSLFIIDFTAILISFWAALFIRFDGRIPKQSYYIPICIVFVAVWFLYSVFMDSNRDFFARGYYIEFVVVLKNVIAMFFISIVLMYVMHTVQEVSRLVYMYFGVIDFALTYALHILYKHYMLKYYKKGNASSKILLVTDSAEVEDVLTHIVTQHDWNYEITGIVIMDRDMTGQTILDIPVIAGEDTLYDVAKQVIVDEVFLHLPQLPGKDTKILIESLVSMGVVCHECIDVVKLDKVQSIPEQFGGYPVVSYSLRYMDYRRLIIKRGMDIFGGLLGMFIVVVTYPFLAIAIKMDSKGPVLFSQIRVGKNGRRFKIYKYRSMYQDAEERKAKLMEQNEMQGLMFKMKDDPRITKVGKWIRKTSLDEIPQFFNVLVGDMSLVGTRPPTEDEFEKYNLYYRRRMSITPGLTGMWQVSGRSRVTDFEDVVKYDLQYIDNWSIGLDIKILLKTILVVIKAKGSE